MLIKIAFQSLRANKMRSLLTMLGIIIGVAAVIAMVSVGDGAKAQVSKRIHSLGSNLLIVRPGTRRSRFVRSGSVTTLSDKDADAIKRMIPDIRYISPEVSKSMQLKYFNRNASTNVLGATSTYPAVNNFQLDQGRFFDINDVHANRKVVVLGATVVKALFPGQNPLGEDVKIGGINFQVIGTLKAKGQSGYRDPDDQVVIPLHIAQRRLFGIRYLRSITIQVAAASKMDAVQWDVTRLLRKRHRIQPGAQPDFNIRNQKEILETMSAVTGTFTMLLASIAAISMLVGGIGIMNIMLVSVTERTREIGVRKAVGATYKDILLQFLVESVVLSVLGGLIGVILGMSASWLISKMGSWQTVLSLQAIGLSFLFAILVGVFFGIYPARRAAMLNPIEALRYE
ncbi:MAG: multidrug ABC transporter substrate-binding protein [Deltaproteobacteria bacterium]|nr:multidrug ABC transporter substrate-binding protein [Deltaproteobacteria bacterium]MBU52404.1 multidrug ABC transporter substrate-binding protein [Deltaproteobacteria bacterium]|tara:strand:- start:1822 stop:3018 length:1197 start_codon:yes stop_codon:yes gene_type:complete